MNYLLEPFWLHERVNIICVLSQYHSRRLNHFQTHSQAACKLAKRNQALSKLLNKISYKYSKVVFTYLMLKYLRTSPNLSNFDILETIYTFYYGFFIENIIIWFKGLNKNKKFSLSKMYSFNFKIEPFAYLEVVKLKRHFTYIITFTLT